MCVWYRGVQNLMCPLQNPELLRSIMMSNPAMRQMIEANPEIGGPPNYSVLADWCGVQVTH